MLADEEVDDHGPHPGPVVDRGRHRRREGACTVVTAPAGTGVGRCWSPLGCLGQVDHLASGEAGAGVV